MSVKFGLLFIEKNFSSVVFFLAFSIKVDKRSSPGDC